MLAVLALVLIVGTGIALNILLPFEYPDGRRRPFHDRLWRLIVFGLVMMVVGAFGSWLARL